MKAVYDTCLYIDMLRSGKHSEIFQSRSHIRYLSPVVVMELSAGARTPSAKRALERLFNPYSKAQRVLSLSANAYLKAGEILQKLSSSQGRLGIHLSHDVLIALSAHSVGATLFTSNKKDFAAIKRYLNYSVEFI